MPVFSAILEKMVETYPPLMDLILGVFTTFLQI